MLAAGGCLDNMCSTPGDAVQKPLQLRWIQRAEAEGERDGTVSQDVLGACSCPGCGTGQGGSCRNDSIGWENALTPGFCNCSPPGYLSPQRVCG